MKKWLIVLGIITCMAGLTACGKQGDGAESTNLMPASDAQELAANWAETIDQVVVSNSESDFVSYMSAQMGWDEAVLEGAVESWKGASEEMGNYIELVEITANSMECETYNGIYYPVQGTISAKIKGSKHDAILDIAYADYVPASISTNIDYTFGESMGRAALNTLLGMGTVFTVLVLISLIIAAFGLIPKLFAPKKQPEEKTEDKKENNVVAQIVEREELSDDTELVAVIAAAIAAYEGSGQTDGFVVRSIRKAKNNRWQNA